MRFATKLTLLFSAIVLAISVIVSYLVYTSNINTFEEQIRDKMEDQAFHTMDKIDRMLAARYRRLKRLAEDPVFTSNASPREILKKLNEFMDASPGSYTSVSFFDMNRVRIADTSGNEVGRQHPLISYWKGIAAGKEFVMDVSRSVSLGKEIFHLAYVVRDKKGSPAGVLVLRMPVEKIYDILNQTSGHSQIQLDKALEVDLVNRDGLIIYSNYNLKGVLKEISPDWEVVQRFLAAGKRLGSERHTHPPEEEEFHAFAVERGYQDFKGDGWILILNIPTKVAFAPAIELRNRVIMTLLGVSAFALLVIWVFARTVTRPIERLSAASIDIGRGKLDTRVEVASGDEIGRLAYSFNRMARNLQSSRGEIISANEYINNILNSMHDSLMVITIEGVIKTANRAALDLLGYTEEELLNRNVSIVFGQGPHEFISGAGGDFLRRGFVSNVERYYLAKDNRPIPVLFSASMMRGPEGLITGIVCVALDNTENRLAAEALRKSEERYRTLFEESKDVVLMGTFDGRILDVNRAGIELLAYPSKEDFMQASTKDLYDEPLDWDRFKRDIREEGFVRDFEAVFRASDGRQVIINMTATVLRGGDGEAIGYRSIMRDITEHKRLEQKLIQAQKMKAIGEFTGKISHDFKNILTVVWANAGILKKRMGTGDPLIEQVDLILNSSKRATNLIQGLLSFSRNQTIRFKPIDVNNIVLNSSKLILSLIGEDVELKTDLSKERLVVMGDSGQMEQVLINLATNAGDAMPGGGELAISTRLIEWNSPAKGDPENKASNYALITVADTGVGMDEKVQERIFEPFFTTKEVRKGTGLGLSIVYGIIERHRGYINVHSEPGKGTTFQIFLPVIRSEAFEEKAEPVSITEAGAGTVLLAEDDPEVRKTARYILEESGYRVIEAEDGDDAVDKYIANVKNVDLLLLDVLMPGKNGREVYEEALKANPGIKALFVSAYTDDIIDPKDDSGRFSLVSKPFSQPELLRRVREAIER